MPRSCHKSPAQGMGGWIGRWALSGLEGVHTSLESWPVVTQDTGLRLCQCLSLYTPTHPPAASQAPGLTAAQRPCTCKDMYEQKHDTAFEHCTELMALAPHMQRC